MINKSPPLIFNYDTWLQSKCVIGEIERTNNGEDIHPKRFWVQTPNNTNFFMTSIHHYS